MPPAADTVWGAAVEYEPKDYKDYSDGRPDVAIHKLEGRWLGLAT